MKALAAVRREPARGPLKANPTRRWAYSSRPSRLTKFRRAQPSSCVCCVTANVRLVPHHAGRQLELGTAKDKVFELLRRILSDFGSKNAHLGVSNHNQHIYGSFEPKIPRLKNYASAQPESTVRL